MRLIRLLGVAGLSALPVLACGDSTGTDEVILEDLVGMWNVTQLEWTRTDGAPGAFDFIQNGGSIAVTVASSGAVSGNGTSFLTGAFTLSGTVMVQGDLIILDLSATPSNPDAPTLSFPTDFSFTLTDNTLSLMNSNAMFDFGFDGIEEPAAFQMVLERAD